MGLTAKQEAFAQAIANGSNQTNAYRLAYDSENMTDKSIWEKASELAASVKVSERIDTLKERLSEKQLWTREESVEALKKVLATESHGALVSAVKELNAMHGFNQPTKLDVNLGGEVELNTSKMSDEALAEMLNAAKPQ